MIYNEKIVKALNIAYDIHNYEKDKIDIPYIFHPFKVAESIIEEESQFGGIKDREALEKCIIIALLHDSIESLIKRYDPDSYVSMGGGLYRKFDSKEKMISYCKKALAIEFGSIVSKAVYTLTRRDDETYDEYIDRVCKDPYAVKVKVHDCKHNLSVNRMNMINDKCKESLSKRYFKALEKLVKYERL